MKRTKRPRVDQTAATAHHEAGHVVARYKQDIPCGKVTIVPGDGYLGMVEGSIPPKLMERLQFGGLTAADERRIDRESVAFLAGHPADARFRGRNNWRGSRSDREKFTEFACQLGLDEELTKAYYSYMALLARQLINAHWHLVEALAAELLKRKTMKRKEWLDFLRATEREHLGLADLASSLAKMDLSRLVERPAH